MSNLTAEVAYECPATAGCDAFELLLQPRDKDLGGFSVRRVLPTAQRRMVGPWIFFDHMGPAAFAPGDALNVRPHPHVNLATVTYLFEGEILHRDSLGSVQAVRPGDLNLMVAGRGIVHSERERPEAISAERRMHGLQLWHALPEAAEEGEPAFYHHPAADLPSVDVGGATVRVMMGSAYGATSPVRTFADTLYIEADLPRGERLVLPDAAERAVYVVKGSLAAGSDEIPEHAMAIFTSAPGVAVEAREDARIAVIGGEPIGPRFVEWNFVSSRKERIEEAKRDWREGRFPRVPGDEREYIPLPA